MSPRYDIRAALVWALRVARTEAREAARDRAAWNDRYQRYVHIRDDDGEAEAVAEAAAMSAEFAHEDFERYRDRWCALDALARVYDDVGGAS